ncbi:acyl-CoA dehydrogenase family protein [Actinophytocola sediminis]
MDFDLDEDARDLAKLTATILADHTSPRRLAEVTESGEYFDRTLWRELAGAGVLAGALPARVGGSGLGLLARCAVLIELGRTIAPAPYLSSIVVGAAGIAEFGTPEQCARWAAPAAEGAVVVTAALAEGPLPTAERASASASAEWHLHGTNAVVPAGTVADLVLVPARTSAGPTVFLVTPKDFGVTIERQEILDGDAEALLEFDRVPLGADRVLGEPGGGARVLDWLTAHATVGLCAHQLGVCEAALQATATHANSRVQFDRAIGTFQAVGQRLADCYIDVEAIRLTLWQAAWRLSENLPSHKEIHTAKFWAADGGHRVAHTAVHIHGGLGIDVGYPLHRYFGAAKRNEFSLGGSTTHLRQLGALMTVEPA